MSIAAARTASQPGLSLAALAAELRDARGPLDALDAGHAAADVRSVLSWSYQQLDPPTARLFRLLGLHPGPDVSAAAAASMAGLPPDEARRRLGELTRACLLTEHAPGRFACHDLLRAYAAELAQSADSEAERRAATARMLGHYLHTAYPASVVLAPTRRPVTPAGLPPGVTPEHVAGTEQALAWFEAECQVLMTVSARALEAGFCTHAWQIPWALSRYLDHEGRWHDWMAAEQISLAAAQRLGDQAAEAGILQRMGYVSGRLANYEDAHAHMKQALRIHAERGDRAGQGYVHNAFAVVLYHQGREHDALDQALQALEALTGPDDQPGRALALNSAGWMYTHFGDHRQALRYCEQAVDLLHDLGNREGEASALDSLGYAHQQLGQHAESVTCYRRSIDLYSEIGHRWGVAETLGRLGDAWAAAGDPEQARTAWEEALAVLADLDHPDAARIRAKLSGL